MDAVAGRLMHNHPSEDPSRPTIEVVLHSKTERLRELDDPPAHEDYGSRRRRVG
jgi:hypothetical protein